MSDETLTAERAVRAGVEIGGRLLSIGVPTEEVKALYAKAEAYCLREAARGRYSVGRARAIIIHRFRELVEEREKQ